MNDLFALYRDDARPQDVKKWVEEERAKVKIKQEEKQRKATREKLTFEESPLLAGKKEAPVASLSQGSEKVSTNVAREIIIAIILIIVAIIFAKKLLALLKNKTK